MVMPKPDNRPDLDFTAFFDNPVPVPPLVSADQQRLISEETEIGAKNLLANGRYVRVLVDHSALPPAPVNSQVLVVEDDIATATLLERVLTKSGLQVTRAHNRAEIIAALNRPQLPDLVLLDVMLPDTTGFDVLARLRANARLKDVRVLILTSLAGDGDVKRGLTLGVNGYLTKPITPAVLLEAIRETMGWA